MPAANEGAAEAPNKRDALHPVPQFEVGRSLMKYLGILFRATIQSSTDFPTPLLESLQPDLHGLGGLKRRLLKELVP